MSNPFFNIQIELDSIKRRQSYLFNLPLETYSALARNTNMKYLANINFVKPSYLINENFINWNKFKINLFSQKTLDEFIKVSNFRKDEILKMNYALRNFNVNIATTSTFTESIDSSHPVDHPQKNRNTDEFKRMLDNNLVTPSKELVNGSAKALFVESMSEFVLKIAFHEPVQTHIYFWVIFFSYLSFLVTHDPNKK